MITNKDYKKEIIRDIDSLGDRSEEIDPKKEGSLLQEIVLSLKQTMKDNDIVSLSAPQIGYNKRVFCVRFGNTDYRTFVNPIIDNVRDLTFARETCHSIEDKEFIRPRYNFIRIIYMTPLGKIESREVRGRTAVVLQHCIDHLDGLLLSDIGIEIDEMFDKAPEAEREELLQKYAESLDIKQKELQKVIEDDKDLKQINDAIKFIDGVRSGAVELEKPSNE